MQDIKSFDDKIKEIELSKIIYLMKNPSVDFTDYFYNYNLLKKTFKKNLNDFIDNSKINLMKDYKQDTDNYPNYYKTKIITLENDTVKIKYKVVRTFNYLGMETNLKIILKINTIKIISNLSLLCHDWVNTECNGFCCKKK